MLINDRHISQTVNRHRNVAAGGVTSAAFMSYSHEGTDDADVLQAETRNSGIVLKQREHLQQQSSRISTQ